MSELIAQVLPVDSVATSEASTAVAAMTQPLTTSNLFSWAKYTEGWEEALLNFGIRVVLALVFFAVGCWVIKHIKHLIMKVLIKREIEGVAVSLINSIVVALLYVVLGVAVAGVLGVQSVSFAAILASMGLAVGMALSGQLQNLAGGVIIVLTRPFTIGHFIHTQEVSGTVKAVTLFHTLIITPDNKLIYMPNGVLSNNAITNFNASGTRRIEWVFGVDYDTDIEQALLILRDLVAQEPMILKEPEHFIGINAFADSSINLVVRAWVKSEDYFPTFFALNRQVYDEFKNKGVEFPFPQVTISQRRANK